MRKIGLISDTHSYFGDDIIEHLQDVDEIWHGGDVGHPEMIDKLNALEKPLRVVYGNIDDDKVRREYPLNLEWECEGVKVFMTHIGGYPGRYTKRVYGLLKASQPDLYICGHSHICKVMKDQKMNLIHMNPGACGIVGFHQIRTMLLFECNDGKIENLRVVELGERGIVG